MNGKCSIKRRSTGPAANQTGIMSSEEIYSSCVRRVKTLWSDDSTVVQGLLRSLGNSRTEKVTMSKEIRTDMILQLTLLKRSFASLKRLVLVLKGMRPCKRRNIVPVRLEFGKDSIKNLKKQSSSRSKFANRLSEKILSRRIGVFYGKFFAQHLRLKSVALKCETILKVANPVRSL